MVKGVSRRVVVVKSPNKRLFEEAIFILSEEALRAGGITAEDIISEACTIASTYVRKKALIDYRKYWFPAAIISIEIILIVGALIAFRFLI